ncbi:MAG: flavodoxin [Faecalibacillus sp.]
MKKLLSLFLVMFVVFSLTGCHSQTDNEEKNSNKNTTQTTEKTDNHILITYYSYSGNTKAAAQEIKKQTDGVLAEITRKEAYPDDFYDIAESEIKNGDQPEISIAIDNIADYDVIFVGYPIWWKKAPAMINTFVHQFDFTGKTVIPFCTSGSDGIEESLDVFDDIQEKADIKEGLRISDYSGIAGWLDKVLK